MHYLVYSKLSTRFEEIIHIFLTFWHCKFGLRGKKKSDHRTNFKARIQHTLLRRLFCNSSTQFHKSWAPPTEKTKIGCSLRLLMAFSCPSICRCDNFDFGVTKLIRNVLFKPFRVTTSKFSSQYHP